MDNTKRHYFIAIEIDSEIKKWLFTIQQAVKDQFYYKNWVDQNDFHITLHFFGAIEQSILHDVADQLEQLKNHSFSAKISGLSTFGSVSRPRVLWMEVEKVPELLQLHSDIQQIVGEYVMIDKRPYTPHITIAKKWASDQSLTNTAILEQRTGEKVLEVNRIVIYEIHPEKKQKYQIWRQFELK